MPTLRPDGARLATRRRTAVLAGLAFAALTTLFASLALSGTSAIAGAADGPSGSETAGAPVPIALDHLVDPAVRAVTDRLDLVSTATGALAGALPEAPTTYCPAPGSEFIDSWGFARSGGRRHKGVDMMAPYGSPVIAPVAGSIRPSNSSLGGIGYYLTDADGNTYFGSHLASLDVTDGWVEAGTQIGTVGSTGNAGTPHLHWEVMLADRGSVNPYPFALEWCSGDGSEPEILPGLDPALVAPPTPHGFPI